MAKQDKRLYKPKESPAIIALFLMPPTSTGKPIHEIARPAAVVRDLNDVPHRGT